MVLRRGDGDVGTDVVEADGAAEGAVHEEVAAAEVVDEEEEPDDGDDGFDDAEDAGGEEGGVGPGHADGFEDCGGVLGWVLARKKKVEEGWKGKGYERSLWR